MRKAFISLLLLLCLAFPTKTVTASDDWSDIVQQVLKSVVYIESGDSSCTGFVINAVHNYVLSAAHCDGKEMWVDRVSAKAISKDTMKDLVIYEVPDLDPTRNALHLADKDPEIGQEVMSIGYGMALERPFFRKAMVSDTAVSIPSAGLGGPFIGLDAAFVGGQSGGPVVNHKGEVVMIVQAASGTTGIGVGVNVIRERTGRFWGAKDQK